MIIFIKYTLKIGKQNQLKSQKMKKHTHESSAYDCLFAEFKDSINTHHTLKRLNYSKTYLKYTSYMICSLLPDINGWIGKVPGGYVKLLALSKA